MGAVVKIRRENIDPYERLITSGVRFEFLEKPLLYGESFKNAVGIIIRCPADLSTDDLEILRGKATNAFMEILNKRMIKVVDFHHHVHTLWQQNPALHYLDHAIDCAYISIPADDEMKARRITQEIYRRQEIFHNTGMLPAAIHSQR